jgi:hypothetical protein
MTTKVQFPMRVDEKVVAKFRDKCAKERRKLGGVVEALMEAWLDGRIRI